MVTASDLKFGPDGLPEGWPHHHGVESLGYDVLEWAEKYLAQPDRETAGSGWRWRESQARFVAWWYALNEQGEFLFRRGQIVLPKGSGKSPLAAALACCEFGGPVVFSHFAEDGRAVGKPHPSPIVQLAAVSFEQTSNVSRLVKNMLEDGTAGKVIPDMKPMDLTTRSRRGELMRIATSARSGEGVRATASFADETHHWIPSNGGREFYSMMRRNLAKTGGRMLELTNCWSPGEESVAEATFRAAEGLVELSGPAQSEARRTLRWQPHVHVEDLRDLDALKRAMDVLYADFPWIDTDNLLSEALAGTTASEIRRFYLNEIVSSDTALVLDADWTECQVSSDDWRPLPPGETVTLGFDGGKTDDATALIACRVEDRTFHVLGIWEKPRDMGHRGRFDWEVDREAVDQRVRHAIDTYDVVGFYSDVALWETYVDSWSALVQNSVLVKAGPRSAVGLDMRGNLKRLTEGTNRLVEAIEDHAIGHDGDERLRRHVLNAQRRPNSWGTSFGKSSRESPDKVDALSAMLLADMARYDYMQSGAAQRRRGGKLIVLQ